MGSARAPIDLTLDSDDESTPPASVPSPSISRPKHMPVPLPGSVAPTPLWPTPRFHHAAVPVPGSQLQNGQSTLPLPSVQTQGTYMAPYSSPSRSNTPTVSQPLSATGYVPVFAGAQNGGASGLEIPQAGKRRKLSVPQMTTQPEAIQRRKIDPTPRFYGVKVGHVPGVYTDWNSVLEQIKGCKGAKQQRFETREEAQAFVEGRHGISSAFADDGPESEAVKPAQSTFGASHGGINQAFPVTQPTTASHPATFPSAMRATLANAIPPSMPAARLNTHRLPSVQSLNLVLKTNGTSIPFPGDRTTSRPRELHIGRFPDPASGPGHTANGLAISVDEMVVDQNYNTMPRKFEVGRQPTKESISSSVGMPKTRLGDTEASVATGGSFNPPVSEGPRRSTVSLPKATPQQAVVSVEGPLWGAQKRTIEQLPLSHQKLPGSAPLPNVGSRQTPAQNEGDSVFSNTVLPKTAATLPTNTQFPPTVSVLSTVEPLSKPKWTGALSEAEAHLLIFLKEVKRLTWTQITATFTKHYPGRSYGTLQTNYSQKINRRDRTQDPPTLILPSCYAAEARVDWESVHGALPVRTSDPPRGRKREVDILQERVQPQPQRSPVLRWVAAGGSLQDQSSGAESSGPYRRPRRDVPVKNYTWPKWNARHVHGEFDIDDDDGILEPAEERLIDSESPEELVPAPEKAIAVDNEPISMDFAREDAFLALAVQNKNTSSRVQHLPYLSSSQRSHLQNPPRGFEWDQLVSRDWQGVLIHVDFTPAELNVVEGCITRLLTPPRALRSRSQRKRLQTLLTGVTEPTHLRLVNSLRSKLRSRDRRSIDAFLQDAKENNIRSSRPRIERLAASRPNKSFNSEARLSTSSMIRRREIGVQSHRGWSSATKAVSYQMMNKMQDSLGPLCSFTGASHDVNTVAWSIDGQCFAAGAICVDDLHSMQYNRPNNLLYGDVSYNTIHELGKHYILRPKPESGPNSTHAMYASQDPKLYKTVTSVAFSPNGKYMFSGGYDNYVSIWETKHDGSQPKDITSLKHKAEVLLMTVNSSGVLATATKKFTGNTVKVLRIYEDDPSLEPIKVNFSSDKAAARPDLSIFPQALHFSPRYENLLLAGFGANSRKDGFDVSGDICLWDINGNKQLNIWGSGKNVFDLSFHPRQKWFAVGCVAGGNVNRGTRSTVRIYGEHDTDARFTSLMELECRAMDMNDVVWCPGDDFLVAAGCTSGRAYVWDVRNPRNFLRELAHGSSLMPLDEFTDREITDTGIRFLAWGNNATRLYTGSSDGIVKVWNVARSEEETFVKDLITLDSGVMSGAFSPDRSRLVLGEVNGSLNVLEVGRDDCALKDAEKMRFVPYVDDDSDDSDDGDAYMPSYISATAADSGAACAKELIETGQMMIKPMGGLPIRQAVQGPAYVGPFDTNVDAPILRDQALEMQHKLAQTPASQCSIPKCQDVVVITSEEIGDSGRSIDRIPDELRLQLETPHSDLKLISGKTHCSKCGRAARPSTSGDKKGIGLCERCCFACFRCGSSANVRPSTEIFECQMCKRAWEIGALGYDCVKESDIPPQHNSVPPLKKYGKEVWAASMEAEFPLGDNNASFGDEMNALTDHYFSLAIDRPESPPL